MSATRTRNLEPPGFQLPLLRLIHADQIIPKDRSVACRTNEKFDTDLVGNPSLQDLHIVHGKSQRSLLHQEQNAVARETKPFCKDLIQTNLDVIRIQDCQCHSAGICTIAGNHSSFQAEISAPLASASPFGVAGEGARHSLIVPLQGFDEFCRKAAHGSTFKNGPVPSASTDIATIDQPGVKLASIRVQPEFARRTKRLHKSASLAGTLYSRCLRTDNGPFHVQYRRHSVGLPRTGSPSQAVGTAEQRQLSALSLAGSFFEMYAVNRNRIRCAWPSHTGPDPPPGRTKFMTHSSECMAGSMTGQSVGKTNVQIEIDEPR